MLNRERATTKTFEDIAGGGSLTAPGAIEVDRPIHSCSSFATRYWLKGETCEAFTERLSRGKHASRSLRSEFIDGVGGGAVRTAHAARIHHKQVAGAVTG